MHEEERTEGVKAGRRADGFPWNPIHIRYENREEKQLPAEIPSNPHAIYPEPDRLYQHRA